MIGESMAVVRIHPPHPPALLHLSPPLVLVGFGRNWVCRATPWVCQAKSGFYPNISAIKRSAVFLRRNAMAIPASTIGGRRMWGVLLWGIAKRQIRK